MDWLLVTSMLNLSMQLEFIVTPGFEIPGSLVSSNLTIR